MKRKIRILLADDHTLLTDVLRKHLNSHDGFEIVGTCSDTGSAVQRAIELNPDIIVMDIEMPGVASFEAALDIRRHCPDAHVVFLSGFIQDSYVDRALGVEASGYIYKGEGPETVVQALRSVAAGTPYFSPEVRKRITVGAERATLGQSRISHLASLNEPEREILGCLARGLSEQQIAARMGLSVAAMASHCAGLVEKLGVHDRLELARFAVRERLSYLASSDPPDPRHTKK